MTAATRPDCGQPFPGVKRVSSGATNTRYRAECHCGWVYDAEGPPGNARGLRIEAESLALLHYYPPADAALLSAFQQLVPAAFSQPQVELLIELVSGKAIQSPAALTRGRAARYNQNYTRAFGNFITRLRGRGAVVEITAGPYGGVGSSTYRLSGYTALLPERLGARDAD